MMNSSATTTTRQPVLFVGHGSPMNVITDNAFRRSWQALGTQFGEGKRWPKPKAMLCVSAHWQSRGTWITSAAQPKTIHDFGGFPAELFAQQYPAPGSAALVERVKTVLAPTPVANDDGQWGFDHGSWGVLKPMFPTADIPLVQLSMDVSLTPAQRLMIGQRLRDLRDEGILIVGSGNIVHNLRTLRESARYDWAVAYDAHVAKVLDAHEFDALAQFGTWPHAQMANPTTEHFDPLLYAAGATAEDDRLEYFNATTDLGGLSMRSMVWSRA